MMTRERTGADGVRCAECGRSITNDVVRVDEGRVYHLRCFRRVLPFAALYECPRCTALGSHRTERGDWTECALCGGCGYLSTTDGRAARGCGCA